MPRYRRATLRYLNHGVLCELSSGVDYLRVKVITVASDGNVAVKVVAYSGPRGNWVWLETAAYRHFNPNLEVMQLIEDS